MSAPAAALSAPRAAKAAPAGVVGSGWVGTTLLVLAVAAIIGPFAWILTASFKYQIAIYSGQWPFTPTLSNYADVLFGRRSDFPGNVMNSLVIASVSTALVLVVGTLAAYSLHRFRWPAWLPAGLLAW